MNGAKLTALIDQIKYERPGRPTWCIRLDWLDGGPRAYIQVYGQTGSQAWTGRKWLISDHMTISEIVQTCLKAILAAEEHEAREFFTFRGCPVFSPHLDVTALSQIVLEERFDVRTNALEGM